jgi:hypothetical protein
MDKIVKYQNAIISLFQEYDDFWGNSNGLKNHIIIDKERNSFAMVTMGWQNPNSYAHLLCFHIEIIDGKIWIHENNTEAMIADELVEKGVARKDIVLGFVEPVARAYSGYAVA